MIYKLLILVTAAVAVRVGDEAMTPTDTVPADPVANGEETKTPEVPADNGEPEEKEGDSKEEEEEDEEEEKEEEDDENRFIPAKKGSFFYMSLHQKDNSTFAYMKIDGKTMSFLPSHYHKETQKFMNKTNDAWVGTQNNIMNQRFNTDSAQRLMIT